MRRYYDCFRDGTRLNIVMEHCAEGDLAQLLKQRRKGKTGGGGPGGGLLLSEDEVMLKFVQVRQRCCQPVAVTG